MISYSLGPCLLVLYIKQQLINGNRHIYSQSFSTLSFTLQQGRRFELKGKKEERVCRCARENKIMWGPHMGRASGQMIVRIAASDRSSTWICIHNAC